MDCQNQKSVVSLLFEIRHDALFCAHVRGIPAQDVNDFAAWCAEYLLVFHAVEAERYANGEHTRSWLRTVIDHRAIEWVRRTRSQRLHEVCWPEASGETGFRQVSDAADTRVTPERNCLCADVTDTLAEIIGQLTPCQQDLFRRHLLDGETLEAIAASQGKTANAIRQQLYQMRRQIIKRLERHGETYESLRQALAPPLHLAMP